MIINILASLSVLAILAVLGNFFLGFILSCNAGTYKLVCIPGAILAVVGFFVPSESFTHSAEYLARLPYYAYLGALLVGCLLMAFSFIIRLGNYLFTSRGHF
ncbi:MAG: hypothetical protein K2X27_25755 [Candidatus Obscuribacterales bacterium]|nr:hypothetical protein [Candidatus Obscuribacterales bacterium]